MNSRQRLELALNHKEADRIPADLGGTVLSGISHVAYRRLRTHLRLPEIDTRIADVVQQIAVVDDDVRGLLQVDVRDVAPRSSANFNIGIHDDMPDYTYFHDEWGIGWKMPKVGGLYYDMFDHPLKGEISTGDIDRYPWPNPADQARFDGLRERARQAAEVEGQGVVIGGLCAGIMETVSWLRGFDDYYMDFVANTRLLEYFLDKVVELKMAYWEKALAEGGEYISAIVEADDMAGQNGMLISPLAYRNIVKPRHRRLFDFIKARTRAKIFFHSCGAVRKAIPDLIEAGIDILNPVQVSAAGMDSAELKREFGRELTFWGGAVDPQNVLGSGSVQQVKDDARRRIDDLAPGGGFVFAPVHNIQSNVPPENVVAMWETLRDHGTYLTRGEPMMNEGRDSRE
jgi:uroporphyrinogen decarboxylase